MGDGMNNYIFMKPQPNMDDIEQDFDLELNIPKSAAVEPKYSSSIVSSRKAKEAIKKQVGFLEKLTGEKLNISI